MNAVLWFKITSPEDAIIKIADYDGAIISIFCSALHAILLDNTPLDEVLREREQIKVTSRIVDTTTEP